MNSFTCLEKQKVLCLASSLNGNPWEVTYLLLVIKPGLKLLFCVLFLNSALKYINKKEKRTTSLLCFLSALVGKPHLALDSFSAYIEVGSIVQKVEKSASNCVGKLPRRLPVALSGRASPC